MTDFRLVVRMLWRDLRSGELTLLLIAVLLAVAALSSVGFVSDRVALALKRDAVQLMGGDLLLTADHAIPAHFVQKARESGLRETQTLNFNSMVSTDASAELAAVKVVENGYPLRGALLVAPAPGMPGVSVSHGPARGEAWLDEQLLSALQKKPGDLIEVGYLRLRVGAIITHESDRGMSFSSFAPRLMMNSADLATSGLIQEGSRVRYRLLLAGDPVAVSQYEHWAKDHLGRGETLESLDNARPEIRSGMERAGHFLRLVAMLTVVLAAVAIGLSSRRYIARHVGACAVMRCLGAQRHQLLRLYLGEFLLLGLAVSTLGVMAGFVLQFGLAFAVRDLVSLELPLPGPSPVAHGVLAGLVLMLGFVAPQLLKLVEASPIRVLRREWSVMQASSARAWLFGALALTGLMLWLAEDWRLGGIVVGGFATAIAVFICLAWASLALLARVKVPGNWGFRYGLSSLLRRRASSVVQIVALALGVTALFLLTFVSRDLMASWQGSIPPDAPNRFVINIQPAQKDGLEAWLTQQGLASASLQPMIRGRLMSVNGKPVSGSQYEEERARNLVEREFNLSWASRLPAENRVTAGVWHGDRKEAAFSVEQGVARTLGVGIGDVVAFNVGGSTVTGRIGSVRKLEWNSMRVNFFFLAAPGVLEGLPTSYITSFHLPPGQADRVRTLVSAFPNLTVIDVSAVIDQVEKVSHRLIQLVQFVSFFALVAGLIVLLAAQRNTHDERAYELTVLRSLGARNRQLRFALLAELTVLALMATLLAGLTAHLMGFALARYVFETAYALDGISLASAVLLVSATIVGLAWPGARRSMRGTVSESLRESAEGAG